MTRQGPKTLVKAKPQQQTSEGQPYESVKSSKPNFRIKTETDP